MKSTADLSNLTVVDINQAHNYSAHECSYSKVSRGSTTCGFEAAKVTALDYNELMERGFRRCGTYFYKPDLFRSHWQWYTLRMDATLHKIRKSHQKAWNRWHRYLKGERDIVEDGDEMDEEPLPGSKKNTEAKEEPAADSDLKKVSDLKELLIAKWADLKPVFLSPEQQVEEYNRIKDKVNVSIDKKQLGAFFSNALVLIANILKLDLKKTMTAENRGAIQNHLKSGGFEVSVAENGIIRWLSSEQMDQAQPPQSEQTKDQKAASKHKKGHGSVASDGKSKQKYPEKKLETKLVPAKVTEENFALYQKYCKSIHEKEKESKSGYERFLCLQALIYKDIISQETSRVLKLGCFHMNYYLDGKLIAVGVIDMVPKGLSSVYFFYDPVLKPLKFGIVGGLYELEMIRDLHKIFPLFKYYYLGFYIQESDKMNYKADFEPCQLLCPKSFRFVTLTDELKKQIKNKQVWLDDKPLGPEELENEFEAGNLDTLRNHLMENMRLFTDGNLIKLTEAQNSKGLAQNIAKLRGDIFCGLGKRLTNRIVFEL